MGVILLIISGITVALYRYFLHRGLFPETDDAYVAANVVQIAAQVSGPVAETYVKNNQSVKKGDLLFKIDPRPYQIAVERAKANLILAVQEMNSDNDSVNIAQEQLNRTKVLLSVQKKHYQRIKTLVEKGQASLSSGDDAKGQLDAALASFHTAEKQLQRAYTHLGSAGTLNAKIQKARAELNQNQLNLDYTDVRSPSNGIVTNFKLREGASIAVNQPLFYLVESDCWWIDANFKETQLKHLKPGQAVSIRIDMYPEEVFTGYIDSISFGSGAAFSLLPPENATGNWVKVTQRFPVKVILNNNKHTLPLRIGASTKVTVDTQTQATVKKTTCTNDAKTSSTS